ncbi:MAG: hypothetical protein ISR65_15485 [Bacteriovoracaceae bacterium]|nr:hypothetical protein [Bacteriovoracaceae bacterium]
MDQTQLINLNLPIKMPRMKQTKSTPYSLSPPYCPNKDCMHHHTPNCRFYYLNGVIKTAKFPFVNQRYICRYCKTQFSSNTFTMDFRKKIAGVNPIIMELKANGMTHRSVGKLLNISEDMSRKRCADLSRQAMIKENLLARQIVIKEDVAYDGFETFSHSQFSPCYVNTAVGSQSFYTYATTFSPLNRKGRMTKQQKQTNKKLREKHGKYPTDSIRQQSSYIFKKLLNYCQTLPLKLHTDEHKAYLNAIKFDLPDGTIEHHTTNSKQARTPKNPLFPVNHLHMIKRHFNSAHRRETIAFNKHEAGLMDMVTLNRIHKNFMRSKFAKGNKGDVHAGKQSPATYIGLTKSIYSFSDFFDMRRHATHADFDQQEVELYRRQYKYSRVRITPYVGV